MGSAGHCARRAIPAPRVHADCYPRSRNRGRAYRRGLDEERRAAASLTLGSGAKVKSKSRKHRQRSLGAPPLAKGLNTLQDRGEWENLGAAYVAS
jgi:hypothetical protein